MSDTPISNQLLTVAQLSTALNFNVKTIRNWCDTGVFPTARRVPNKERGQWRVLSDDIALLDMLDGHADNAAMLADQQTQITELQQLLAERTANYDKLMAVYETSLVEQNQLESELLEVQQFYNKLMTIHKESLANHESQIAELQPYKDHYEEQQRRKGKAA